MITKEEVLNTLRQEMSDLKSRHAIGALALFGSVSRDEQTESSDIDLMIEIDGQMGWDFITLSYELEELLGVKVDLVSRGAIRQGYFDAIQPHLLYI